MKPKTPSSKLTYSYLALRNAVGWIGILLPFVLLFGVLILFKCEHIPITISHYYYSGMRDVFVGALCAVALFLFYYCGYDKWDNWAGNIGGCFALGVAWFPTTQAGPIDWRGTVHFTCAALLFLTLAIISIFLFTKSGKDTTRRKLTRNKIYVICGLIMIACLIGIVLFNIFSRNRFTNACFVYWAETIALVSFGISWLTKGGTLYPDK